VVVIRRLESKSHSILHHQVKKTIVCEPIITVDLPAASHFHLSRHTNISHQTATHLIRARTSKILTDPRQDHIEMIVAIKTMVEVVDNRWHSVNLLRDNAQQLPAGTAGDAR
jgi:hypothetical protein